MDIYSVEDLFDRIRSTRISPTPILNHLWFTYDWRSFIIPNLTEPGLKNHSLYGCFQLKQEDGVVKFRGKRYVYDKQWIPSTGIKLVKDIAEIPPIQAAEFNMGSLKLDMTFNHLETKLYPILSPEEIIPVKRSWDWLRENLDKWERNWRNIPALRILDLPLQQPRPEPSFTVPDNFKHLLEDDDVPVLEGNIAPDTSISPKNDLECGNNVVIWTQCTADR